MTFHRQLAQKRVNIEGISAGNNFTITFDSVADFRVSSGIPTETVSVIIRGYYGPNTPGGGDFLARSMVQFT